MSDELKQRFLFAKVGDEVLFLNSQGEESYCEIVEINHFDSYPYVGEFSNKSKTKMRFDVQGRAPGRPIPQFWVPHEFKYAQGLTNIPYHERTAEDQAQATQAKFSYLQKAAMKPKLKVQQVQVMQYPKSGLERIYIICDDGKLYFKDRTAMQDSPWTNIPVGDA